ncbi:MAG: YHS domain-containing protein [Rhodospirillales bacterium]|nr:YHS domain-containing protein [Rhodospirillales bacterium]
MRKTFLIASLAAVIAGAGVAPAFAVNELNTVPGLTAAGAPLALHGHDPVAFLKGEGAKKGSAKFTAVYDKTAYYFTSQANLDAFKAEPAKYAPQNGGFCTFGVSVGKKFDGDPSFAAVEGGKLYVFLNEEIYGMFLKDKAGTIAKAAVNWPKIMSKAPSEL